jgi:hypothetical protein
MALPYRGLLAYIGSGNAPWYSTGDNRAPTDQQHTDRTA